ncbi:hypothetical protein HPB51_000156 [Rhipicephalus microplus]|uniref:Carboxylesterase type B domain-containing protein n=1 Tax=Rhipicephalus microplus TaxID=6941 RepID=A0A9J6EVU7_RHIMP|nr:hypothetical protein HPB51_000156 [Rhipicephalus microplus]
MRGRRTAGPADWCRRSAIVRSIVTSAVLQGPVVVVTSIARKRPRWIRAETTVAGDVSYTMTMKTYRLVVLCPPLSRITIAAESFWCRRRRYGTDPRFRQRTHRLQPNVCQLLSHDLLDQRDRWSIIRWADISALARSVSNSVPECESSSSITEGAEVGTKFKGKPGMKYKLNRLAALTATRGIRLLVSDKGVMQEGTLSEKGIQVVNKNIRMWGESEDKSRGVSYLIRIYERERAEKVCQVMYAALFALFLTLFAYFVVYALSTGTIVRVRTEVGLVSGELRWVLENNVFHYLGLPYASKPARFQRAVPADRRRLNHVVAQFPGVRCMQVVENGSNITWPKPQIFGEVPKSWYSEDCLYLNIWSPVPPCDYTNDVCHASAPVVVVLFSVGFGQGGADWYDGAILASLGGVVVVAPNFRLGPLAVPLKEDQPQEVPLLSLSDQMLAIKWTWRNIKYFGGNTTEISLLGAGGGAWTVGEMVLSNRENVRDIIKRVLLHGGSPLQRYAPFRAYLVEKAIGCGPASAECLDTADTSKLLDLASQRLLGPPATILAAEPKHDDGIDVLVGYVAGQGRRLASDFFHDIARDVSSRTSNVRSTLS